MIGDPNDPRVVILEVECGGETHRIRIEGDKPHRRLQVTMLDHEEQTVEAFTAFGAKEPACLQIARVWREDPQWAAHQLAPGAHYATHVACPICSWEAPLPTELEPVDYSQYEIQPGDIAPAGECPQCGTAAYLTFGARRG
jgi:hypothetical protein